jgi:hypothetical protein
MHLNANVNPNYNPYVHFKSSLLYDWCMFTEFHPLMNIFIQVSNLIHKYFFQIDDFTMWHLNRVYSIESP